MMKQKIGVIGLGIMGSAISANLIKADFSVIGYDIQPECIKTLEGEGGTGAASVREVAEAAEIVITSLPSVTALQNVVSGPDGLLAADKKGLVVIEVSTFPIEAKQEAYGLLENAGIAMLDCPLSGTG
ncbi:MAG: NAD(P)-dependent oxidoreductase, partial [Desulfocapsaceae bacterium]